MSKRKKNVVWIGVALLVVIIGVWGCNLFDRDNDISPTGPGSAVGLINGYVGGGTVGALYTACNDNSSQFCVSLSQGCWLIKYYSKSGTGPHYAAANVGGSLELVNIGMTQDRNGPAKSVSVAKITGACPVKTGEVILQGTGNQYTPPATGNWMAVINANGVPIVGGGQPKCPEGSSAGAALQTFQAVTVSLEG